MPPPDPHPPEVFDILKRKDPRTRIAVAGASNNPEKYGNIIVRNLRSKGYTVVPVNPREPMVEGIPAFRSVRDLDAPVDLLVIVTPPPATLRILGEAAEAGVPAVWLQDGSFDAAVLEFARKAPFRTVHQACVMVASNY